MKIRVLVIRTDGSSYIEEREAPEEEKVAE